MTISWRGRLAAEYGFFQTLGLSDSYLEGKARGGGQGRVWIQMDLGINLMPAMTEMTKGVDINPVGHLLSATLLSSDRFPPDTEIFMFS